MTTDVVSFEEDDIVVVDSDATKNDVVVIEADDIHVVSVSGEQGAPGAGANLGALTGIVAKIDVSTFAARTLASLTAALVIANGDGVAGNPTFELAGTTLADYGITDAYTKPQSDALYLPIAGTAANASQLLGTTWAAPAAIGTTTPAAASFTTLSLPTTSSSTNGVINQNGSRFIHSFGTANLFVGSGAGNFTLTGTTNAAVGAGTLSALTTGTRNMAFGSGALQFTLTTGNDNVAVGSSAGNQVGSGNTGNIYVGSSVGLQHSGNSCVFIGYQAQGGATTVTGAVVIGQGAKTTGDSAVIIGRLSGGSSTSGSGNCLVGYNVQAPTATTSNWFNFAGVIQGDITSGRVLLGTTTVDASAILNLASTTMGFLPPRMTTAQRDAIPSPTPGLVIWNTDTGKLNQRGTSAWEAVTSA